MPVALTVRTAAALVDVPAAFVTVTVYEPASVAWALETTSNELVAPRIGVPAKFHWKVGGGKPDAVTQKAAVAPVFTVWESG